jgi:D-alanine-D-alanine ligase
MIVRHLPYDAAEVQNLLKEHGEMLLEELVEGVEVTVAVLGEKALPCIEIAPPEGGEFDYDNKYNGATAELCPPQHVSAEHQREAQALAEKLHWLAGGRHLSRTDMILAGDGRIYVLELNTLPGLTSQSLYPKAAKAAGLEWEQLVERLVELARQG